MLLALDCQSMLDPASATRGAAAMEDHNQANVLETERAERLLKTMTPAGWVLDLGGGWTVGTMILHLAYWDRMTSTRLRAYVETGRLAEVPDEPTIDAINDAARWQAVNVTLGEGAAMFLQAAGDIDGLVSSLSPQQVQHLFDKGREFWARRFLHRRAHLPRIEQALGH